MEAKDLVISALNGAIKLYARDGGRIYEGDEVVDYNIDSIKVANFTYRHPGWIMLYVKLKEGSGCFFLKMEYSMFINKVYIAWEEDNVPRGMLECLRYDNKDFSTMYYKDVKNEFEQIINKGLRS